MDKQNIQTELRQKLEAAWVEYTRRILGYSPHLIFNRAGEIAATEQVLRELRDGAYPAETLEYLLRFENPLEVVRDHWLDAQNVAVDEEMGHVLWNLMDKRDAEQAYELDPIYNPDTPAAGVPEPNAPKTLKTLKLYYPAKAVIFERTEYGDLEEEPYELTDTEAAGYLPQVLEKIVQEQMDEEMERGLMAYYDKDNTVDSKVFSAKPSAEVIDGRLYGVAVCRLHEDLTPEEMTEFQDYWSGQMADGWGESYEQREIRGPDRSEIYVSFWDSGDHWSIQTLDELRSPTRFQAMEQRPMDTARFWSIIEKAGERQDSQGSIARGLTSDLKALSPREILQFDAIFRQYHDIANTWLVWSAGNLVTGSMSDDTFAGFRSWLVGRGQETYRNVMQNPDTLSDFVDIRFYTDEGALYAAGNAYNAVRGADNPDYYQSRAAGVLTPDVEQEISDSIQPHPQMGRRVESLEDAQELLPRCNDKYAGPDHQYDTWLHPADFHQDMRLEPL